MTPVFVILLFGRATSCTRLLRLASDNAPATASAEIERDQVLKARFKVLPESRSSELLDEAVKSTLEPNDIVVLNLKHVVTTREPFKVLGMAKTGPDGRGYLTYTVTYQPMVPEVVSLFYTVKEGSTEASLLNNEAFRQDSLVDVFRGKGSKDEFTDVQVNRERTCWPQEKTTDEPASAFRFCTFELQFKNPKLATADVKAIDVKKKYTSEHESQYKGTYFQINGEDALDQNELTTLQSGVLSAICYLYFIGVSSAKELASHVTNTDREVIANIFGGSPSHYITLVQGVGCNDDNTCTMEIEWGEATDASIHKFAIKKSVEKANEDLTRLTKAIFNDKWTIRKITNKIKRAKNNAKKKKVSQKKGAKTAAQKICVAKLPRNFRK